MALTISTERGYCDRCNKHKEVMKFHNMTIEFKENLHYRTYICHKCLSEIVEEFKK